MTQFESVFLQSLHPPALLFIVWYGHTRDIGHHELHSAYSGQVKSTYEFMWMTNVHIGRSNFQSQCLHVFREYQPLTSNEDPSHHSGLTIWSLQTRADSLTNRPHGKILRTWKRRHFPTCWQNQELQFAPSHWRTAAADWHQLQKISNHSVLTTNLTFLIASLFDDNDKLAFF